MLTHPTLDRLRALKLEGMAKAFEEQLACSDYQSVIFEDRLGFLVDREIIERENRRFTSRLKKAKLRQQACIEDLDYQFPRGLDKSLIRSLATCQWIREHLNVLVTGPTGVGKSYIACALAHRACVEGFKVLYFRASRLFQEFTIARGDGRYSKLMNTIAKSDLVVLDDWGLSTLTHQEQSDFLELLEDRHGIHSTLLTSQYPVSHWHELMENPTLADAILDRLVNSAYKLAMSGESMRKKKAALTTHSEMS